ncbi:MAG: hypothetical protein H0T53_05185 [Herpetosiphonaceae bacterium]|nr:hypothetical protein [Herpetosiphonaceae bacterium]
MKRLFLGSGIVLGLAAVLVLLGWIRSLDAPKAQYPLYPHSEYSLFHSPSQVGGKTKAAWLEFRTSDSFADIRNFYTTTLVPEHWILTVDMPNRLVFQKTWSERDRAEELIIQIRSTTEALSGTVAYREYLYKGCAAPVLC